MFATEPGAIIADIEGISSVESHVMIATSRLMSRPILHSNFQQVLDLQVLNIVADVLIVLQVSTLVVLVLSKFAVGLDLLADFHAAISQ